MEQKEKERKKALLLSIPEGKEPDVKPRSTQHDLRSWRKYSKKKERGKKETTVWEKKKPKNNTSRPNTRGH